MADQILFYHQRDVPYGCFSNFSPHPVTIYGRTWRTSEHPFQAMKFHPHAPHLVQAIWEAAGPMTAATIGRDRTKPCREDWNSPLPSRLGGQLVDDGRGRAPVLELVKDAIMFEIVLAKFEQNDDIRKVLLDTTDAGLVENSLKDPYWGWGISRIGVNRLGKILMAVRAGLSLARWKVLSS